MDTFSIGTAILALRRDVSRPSSLDEDLRALYEYKRSLQPDRTSRSRGLVRAEIAEGLAHFGEALRLVFRRPATH
jgi:hypothetical protein